MMRKVHDAGDTCARILVLLMQCSVKGRRKAAVDSWQILLARFFFSI